MKIREIKTRKTDFLDLLLIGDEQTSMIEKYLDKCALFVLFVGNYPKAVCAAMRVDADHVEIKNLAVSPQCRNKGYASALIDFVCKKYEKVVKFITLGTGENEKILNFYKKRGFYETHRLKNFFVDNYDHQIFEDGRQLVDMIYMRKDLILSRRAN